MIDYVSLMSSNDLAPNKKEKASNYKGTSADRKQRLPMDEAATFFHPSPSLKHSTCNTMIQDFYFVKNGDLLFIISFQVLRTNNRTVSKMSSPSPLYPPMT